ncbi:preprotein translocase subunit SecG [Derxia gummosa]|uniref:Protein-export membrane protein SecG n=1 Tax=Derxia gummosa DSM 723 TaxID=1121388 RepID=A0A9U5GYQ5_9BURK|nr:preprotein translocase subunit SecG [Derxia gummosa]
MILQLAAAIAVIVLVLLQHGKGADMGAAFGSGASGSLFGATGSANFLSRSTAVAAAVFFVCTLVLAMISNSGDSATGGVMSGETGAAIQVPAASEPVVPKTTDIPR